MIELSNNLILDNNLYSNCINHCRNADCITTTSNN